jgi:hypothetical protein
VHDEHDVDVRGDDLCVTRSALHRIAPLERREPRQDRGDGEAFLALVDEDPVPRRSRARGRDGPHRSALGEHRDEPSVDTRDATRRRRRLRLFFEERVEARVPSERAQCRGFGVHAPPSLPFDGRGRSAFHA